MGSLKIHSSNIGGTVACFGHQWMSVQMFAAIHKIFVPDWTKGVNWRTLLSLDILQTASVAHDEVYYSVFRETFFSRGQHSTVAFLVQVQHIHGGCCTKEVYRFCPNGEHALLNTCFKFCAMAWGFISWEHGKKRKYGKMHCTNAKTRSGLTFRLFSSLSPPHSLLSFTPIVP